MCAPDPDRLTSCLTISYNTGCGGACHGKDGKTIFRRSETAPYHIPDVAAAIEEEKKFQKFTGVFNDQTVDGMDGFIFCNRFGGMFNEASLNRALKRICGEYNRKEEVNAKREGRPAVLLPNFSCHVLRHTFCTRLCELETNVKVIQPFMGHADITTTMNIYADCTEDKKRII